MSDLTLLPQTAAFPQATELPSPLSPVDIGSNPYGGNNFVYGSNMDAYQANTQLILQNRAIEQSRLQSAAQFAAAQSVTNGSLDSNPSEWTPQEAAQQTDRALAKLSTINPEMAQYLADQRTGQDSGGGLLDGILHVAGEILHPALAAGGKLLDIVARTANIVPNMAFDLVDGGDFNIATDIGGALTGNTRHNWNSVFQEMGWEGGGAMGWLRAGLGLAGDIATDPLTWLIPAGAGVKVEEAAAMAAEKVALGSKGIKAAAEHVAELGARTDGVMQDIGAKMKTVYDAHFKDVVGEARRLGMDVSDLDERFFAAMDGKWSQAETDLYRQMFEAGDKTYRLVRSRGLKSLKDGLVLSDGTQLTVGEVRGLLEQSVKRAGGAAYGSAEWTQGRAFASIAGGLRMKVAVPYTSFRYISPALDIARFWGSEGRYASRLLGTFNNFFAGQSGMVGMLKKIGEGEASFDHLAYWMENGWGGEKGFAKTFPELAEKMGNKYHGAASMMYSAADNVGQITAALTPHAAASRAGLAGYHYGVRATVEANAARNAFIREVVNKALGHGAGEKLNKSVEAALGNLIDDPNVGRYIESVMPAVEEGVDPGDLGALRAWFTGRHPELLDDTTDPEVLAKLRSQMAVMQEAAGKFTPEQRMLLGEVSKVQNVARDEATKKGSMIGDVRYDFEDAKGIPTQQVPEWQKGAGYNHPLTTDGETHFYLHAVGADANELDNFGITSGHAFVDDQGHGFTVSSKRISPEDREVALRGNYMELAKDGDQLDANLIAFGDQKETTVSEARRNISKAVREAANGIKEQRADASGLFERVRSAAGENALDNEQLARMEGEMLTEEMRRRMPQHAGTYTVAEDGTIHVNVWDKPNVKLVGDAHPVVGAHRGYWHRTLSPKILNDLHGVIPGEEAQILLKETVIKAEIERETINMTFDEANDYVRNKLLHAFPKLADKYAGELPDFVFSTHLLDVHTSYLERLGRDVEGRILGRYADRAGRLARLQPHMFGSAPRGQEFEWALKKGTLEALKGADKHLSDMVMKLAKKGAAFQKYQHQFYSRVAKDWGDFALYTEDMLRRGLNPNDPEVTALGRYFARVEDVKATIAQARQVVLDRTTALDAADAQYAKILDDYAKTIGDKNLAGQVAEAEKVWRDLGAQADEAQRALEGAESTVKMPAEKIEPRKVEDTSAPGRQRDMLNKQGRGKSTGWEDPETGQVYRTKSDAERAIAKRTGQPHFRGEKTEAGDYIVTDANGQAVSDERYATAKEANAEARKYQAAHEKSLTPEVQADVTKYGDVFSDTDASIRKYKELGVEEPWNEWEWPRRLAAHDRAEGKTVAEQAAKTVEGVPLEDARKAAEDAAKAAEDAYEKFTKARDAADAAPATYQEARDYLASEVEQGRVFYNKQTGSVLNKDGALVAKGGGKQIHPPHGRALERADLEDQLRRFVETERRLDGLEKTAPRVPANATELDSLKQNAEAAQREVDKILEAAGTDHPLYPKAAEDLRAAKKALREAKAGRDPLATGPQTARVSPQEAHELAQRLTSNPGEQDMLEAYINEHGPFVYHGTDSANLGAIEEQGVLSEKGRGIPAPSDEEFDDISEPYLWDGVFTGGFDRAAEHGDGVVVVDLRELEDGSVFEFFDGDVTITENIPPKALVRETLSKADKQADSAATAFAMARTSHNKTVKEATRIADLLAESRTEMERAMNEVNQAAAKAKGLEAQVKPALFDVDATGGVSGLTALRVPGMEGKWMPDYIAAEWHAILDQHGPKYLTKQWRRFLLGPWKRWATYRNPGFHIRNWFGAWFNNWLGGVNTLDYAFSHHVNAKKFRELPVSNEEFVRYRLGEWLGQDAKGKLTYGDIADHMVNSGITGGNVRVVTEAANTADVLADAMADSTKITKAFKRVDGVMRKAGEITENFHRVAAWSRGMAATEGDTYGARAFTMMRHGDYADLTAAEEHIRNVVPFYKWMRTNIPYQIRMLAENPAQVTLLADKVKSTAYDAYGVNRKQAELGMPGYMKETLGVPIPGWVPFVGTKDPNNIKYAMFDLPYTDLYNGFNDYFSSALPLARNVLESYALKENTFTGRKLGEGHMVPLSGAFNLPGIRELIAATPFAQKGPNGSVYMSDTTENVLTAFPLYSRFRNFIESDPQRQQQRLAGFLSWVGGVQVREADFTQAELDFYYQEVEPTLTSYRDMGVVFPNAQDFVDAGDSIVGAPAPASLQPDAQGTYYTPSQSAAA